MQLFTQGEYMKKYFIGLILLVLLVGCVQIVTPTPVSTATPLHEVTPTATEFLKTPEAAGTNTPNATVTPFILPSATATLPATPTQFVPTNVPECINVPCGPNLFFNAGFDSRSDWNVAQGNPFPFVLHQEFPEIPNILVPEFWHFEYKLGVNERNPGDPNCGQLNTPETTPALRDNPGWAYRVDGYDPINNPEAFRWFKTWGCINAGPTQSVTLLEGRTYDVSFKVSTWSNTLEGMQTYHEYSLLENDEQKSNVEYRIRYNLSNGSVFDGNSSRAFGYNDGIYDFVRDSNGVARYNGYISMRFTVPYDSDDDNVTQVNIGVTGNAKFAFDAVDYHVDNAGLYCLDCGYGPIPTNDPNATPTQMVIIDIEGWKGITVVAQSLPVRKGASTDSPKVLNDDGTPKRVLEGFISNIISVYQNQTTGEIWAQISEGEWIAVQHSTCENNICGILNK